MLISTSISRRNLLKGAALAFATPYISAPAYAGREHIIHIVNMFDESSSIDMSLRQSVFEKTAEVFRNDMSQNMRDSEYTHAIVQNFCWSGSTTAIHEPLTLNCTNAGEGLASIADHFETLAKGARITESGNTLMLKALKVGMGCFTPAASYRSLNVITDDDAREDEAFYWSFKQTAVENNVVVSGMILGDTTAHNDYFAKYVATKTGRSFIASVSNLKELPASLRRILVIDAG